MLTEVDVDFVMRSEPNLLSKLAYLSHLDVKAAYIIPTSNL